MLEVGEQLKSWPNKNGLFLGTNKKDGGVGEIKRDVIVFEKNEEF